MRSLINLIKVRAMRKEHDLKVMNMSFHMVFTGNPGTGKTTVARLVAKIYKQLGFLSKGQLIETDRSGLVAGYVGQTAGKVHDGGRTARWAVFCLSTRPTRWRARGWRTTSATRPSTRWSS